MANKQPPVIDDADYLVDQKKLGTFYDKVRDMVRQEFGVDADGDSLIQIGLVDRTRYWGNQYFLIPYDHKAKTADEHEKILRDLLTNLEIATREVRQRLDLQAISKLNFFGKGVKKEDDPLAHVRWICGSCTTVNDIKEKRCVGCRKLKPLNIS